MDPRVVVGVGNIYACEALFRAHIHPATAAGRLSLRRWRALARAVRATLKGESSSPDRAVVAHIDTLGAMVRALKPNGRVELVAIGHWNARFAEGARSLRRR